MSRVAAAPAPRRPLATAILTAAWLLLAAAPAPAQTLLGTVQTGLIPSAVAVDSINNKIYIANNMASGTTMTVINGADNSVIHAPLTSANGSTAIAVNTVGQKAFVVNSGSGSVMRFDLASTQPAPSYFSKARTDITGPVAVAVNDTHHFWILAQTLHQRCLMGGIQRAQVGLLEAGNIAAPLVQHTANTRMRILNVVDRIIVGLCPREVNVEHQL